MHAQCICHNGFETKNLSLVVTLARYNVTIHDISGKKMYIPNRNSNECYVESTCMKFHCPRIHFVL